MLSLSADLTETDVDLKMINGQSNADGGVAHGEVLMNFAEALPSRDEAALGAAREALLREAGPEILVDVAAIAGNFQRMVRIADATGIPLDDRNVAISGDVCDELDLASMYTAQNTPPPKLRCLHSKRLMIACNRRRPVSAKFWIEWQGRTSIWPTGS